VAEPPFRYSLIAPPNRDVAGPFGDGEPAGHARLLPDRYSGTIGVRMVAKTHLLVPSAEVARDANGHPTKRTRVDGDGRPLIPSTSVKGMLRSAYELVTNSRYGVASKANLKALEKAHHPARSLGDLSPADRVFGWVMDGSASQVEHTRWAGCVSVGPVVATPLAKVVAKSTTLKVLGQPRDGDTGIPEYRVPNRKVYPHHQEWGGGGTDSPKRGNQTWLDHIEKGSGFTFVITVRNLSRLELGALLYLLKPPVSPFNHRLGGAKPYGYGSVVLRVTFEPEHAATPVLALGSEWAEHYRSLGASPVAGLGESDMTALVNEFVDAANAAGLGSSLKGLEDAAVGFKGTFSYPREQAPGQRQGGGRGHGGGQHRGGQGGGPHRGGNPNHGPRRT